MNELLSPEICEATRYCKWQTGKLLPVMRAFLKKILASSRLLMVGARQLRPFDAATPCD